MRTLSRRRPAALLAVAALLAALTACASTANAGSTPSPKNYESVPAMIADADLVVTGVAQTATDETVIDDIPWTRIPVTVNEPILGEPETGNILVSQMGTAAQPPAQGLPRLLEAGRTYVLVLARTGESTYDIVGPGVWWNPSGKDAELFVSDGDIDSRIPHDTTLDELTRAFEEQSDVLGTGS